MRALERTADIMREIVIGLLLAMIVCILASAAQAQEATGTTVDFAPVLMELIPIVVAVLGAFGAWAIRWLVKKLKLDTDDRIRMYLADGWYQALEYGRARAERYVTPGVKVDLRSMVIAKATRYMLDSFPDGLRHFGITPTGVEARLEARLNEWMPAGLPDEPETPATEPLPTEVPGSSPGMGIIRTQP